jgi:hypothetical protein
MPPFRLMIGLTAAAWSLLVVAVSSAFFAVIIYTGLLNVLGFFSTIDVVSSQFADVLRQEFPLWTIVLLTPMSGWIGWHVFERVWSVEMAMVMAEAADGVSTENPDSEAAMISLVVAERGNSHSWTRKKVIQLPLAQRPPANAQIPLAS